MADYLNPQDLANAKVDAKTLGEAVNDKKIVKPRYGDSYKSIPMLSADGDSAISELKKAIDIALAAGVGGAGWGASLVLDDSGLTQQEINDQLTGSRTIDMSYLRPSVGFDIHPLLKAAVDKSTITPVSIILPHGDFVLGREIVAPDKSKGVVIDMNGSILRAPSVASTPKFGYLISLGCPDANYTAIHNGVLDGSNREQNLFETKVVADLSKGCNGAFLQAKHAAFTNITFQHMYGQTSKVACHTFTAQNVMINDCGGHWYTNDGYDMFGDAFYIGTGWCDTGVIYATLNNVHVRAKQSNQYAENHQSGSPLRQVMYSRIGLTLEKFYGDNNNVVYVSFNECDIRGVERGIHQEIKGITSYITMRNTRFDSCVLFGSYLSDTLYADAEFCRFGLYDSNYNDSWGLARGYGGTAIVSIRDSHAYGIGTNGDRPFGLSATLTLERVKCTNFNGLLGDGVTLTAIDCPIEVVQPNEAVPYWFWASTCIFIGCAFTIGGVKQTYTAAGMRSVKDCSFVGAYPEINTADVLHNTGNYLVSDTLTEAPHGTLWGVRKSNGVISVHPRYLWGVPISALSVGETAYHTKPKGFEGDILPPLTSQHNGGLCVVVVHGYIDVGISRMSAISPTASGKGYYVALARRDKGVLKRVGDFVTVGSVDGGFNLTFGDDFTITEYGTYAYVVHVAVLPYRYLDTLPEIPLGLIYQQPS